MRIALDTNILAYAEGGNNASMRTQAKALLKNLPREEIGLPVQVLGELYRVLVSKKNLSPRAARIKIEKWSQYYSLIDTSSSALSAALDLATTHQFHIWDAIIFGAAVEAQCALLLSEDMHDGFAWNGTTVINPFKKPMHPKLTALIEKSAHK